jgi:hypothetical protein
MHRARIQILGWVIVSSTTLALAGCSHPAYGPSGDDRLESAVHEANDATKNNPQNVSNDDINKQKCSDYRPKLAKAKSEDLKEEERLDAYMSLYKDLKEKNDYLEKALATNPDLQFQNESQVPKIRDECVAALADVRTDYYNLVIEIADLLVVQDIHGKPAARLDLKKFRDAVTVLDPDDRDALLARIDNASKKIAAQ